MKISIALVFGLFSLSAFAAESREFFCSVDTFIAKKGWTQGKEVKFLAPVKEWQGSYAQTSGVISLPENYEVVFDAKWEEATLQNDDVTMVPDPRISLEARIQKKLADGNVKILDWAPTVVGRLSPESSVTRRISVTSELKDLEKYSKHLNLMGDKGMSNDGLDRGLQESSVQGALLFNVNCSTHLSSSVTRLE